MTQDALDLDFGLDALPGDAPPEDALRKALRLMAIDGKADRLGFFAAPAKAGTCFQDFVTLALFRFGAVDSLTVCTVFLADSALDSLADWLAMTAPKKTLIILGKQMTQTRYDHVIRRFRQVLATGGGTADVKYIHHHTKFIVARRGSDALLLASSANLNRNDNAENYCLSTAPEICAAFDAYAAKNLGAKVLRRFSCR